MARAPEEVRDRWLLRIIAGEAHLAVAHIEAAAGFEVANVAGAGHMGAGDRNDAFNRSVIGFLRHHVPKWAGS